MTSEPNLAGRLGERVEGHFVHLTTEDVVHVAALARLHVTSEETESLVLELSRILDYARDLQELDLSGVPATSQIGITTTVVRADEPRPSLTAAQAVANAPDEDEGMFRVPAVLEG